MIASFRPAPALRRPSLSRTLNRKARRNGSALAVQRLSGKQAGRPDAEVVAAVVQRLAVILEAGVHPYAAWGHLGSTPDAETAAVAPVIRAACTALKGTSLATAIASAAPSTGSADATWRAVAAAWRVSELTGAPLAPCLTSIADALLDQGATQRAVQVALAGPASSARLVLALPFVGLLFGSLLGFDSLRFLGTTGPGWFCMGAAALLVLIAVRWSAHLVRGATPAGRAPGLLLDLTVIALASGRSVQAAQQVVAESLTSCGLDGQTDAAETADRDSVLRLSQRAGIPASLLLAAEAQSHRRDAQTSASRRAEQLGTTLLLPLGLCVLPAFILVGVVPIIAGILTGAATAF